MKKVFIKYNPYKLETEILVDESKLAENSKLSNVNNLTQATTTYSVSFNWHGIPCAFLYL